MFELSRSAVGREHGFPIEECTLPHRVSFARCLTYVRGQGHYTGSIGRRCSVNSKPHYESLRMVSDQPDDAEEGVASRGHTRPYLWTAVRRRD
jgi:hypothetical protein